MKRLAVYLVFFLIGCGQARESVDPEADIVSRFKKLANKIEENNQKAATASDRIKNVAIDVEKTDSLVSPYTGKITFISEVGEKYGPRNWILKYAYQDSKWTLKAVLSEWPELKKVLRSYPKFINSRGIDPYLKTPYFDEIEKVIHGEFDETGRKLETL